jgi:hypothetical protein
MNRNKLVVLIAAMLLVSCSKAKTMYKYEYTTPKSVAIGVSSSHLGDYDHMNTSELEKERLHQRGLVLKNKGEIVLSDTMYIY